ncbi:hypothetical protein SSX86_023985 [Deinandra increscens subsp. villosa]|uniref:MATH domain-containing protein n=1 Tax=Deinandra increscens subsp. villosa TaxID=3103831 RepID=A0AAP0GNA8_9ASTR
MTTTTPREQDNIIFKIILIGDPSVGKTNLLSRFRHNKFTLESNSTVGIESTTTTLIIDGHPVTAQIFDTSGHTKPRAYTEAYFRGAAGALLVYDVTKHITFVNTQKWLADLRNQADPNVDVMLVGNKSDVRHSVMVSSEVGKSFAEKESLCFVETSALRATNVEKAFTELVERLYRDQVSRKKDMEAHETMALSRSVSISSGNNEPAHYKLKIEAFSLLSEAGIENYESDVFEASGYKWSVKVYPKGSKKELVSDHISVYLVICDTENLEKDWEVHVYFKIFIYDHIRHNYLTIQGGDGERTRFHEKKTRWGFRKLISLDSFTEAENGYLFGDSCEFGAEVFVVPKYTQKDQCLSMMKPPVTMNTHLWTISSFSILKEEALYSEDFKIGKVKWKLSLYPKGFKTGKNTNLSIFLRPHDGGPASEEWKVYAKFKILVKNQNADGTDKTEEADHWFCKTTDGWGFPCFMLLSDLHDYKKGFLSNDTLIVEAKILIVGILKHLV